MSGMGLIRYTTKKDIEKLYGRSNVEIQSIERMELHTKYNTCLSEWIIEVKKSE